MAKRRINMITSNVNSYSRVVNSQEYLDAAMEINGLVAVLGEMKANADQEKAAKLVRPKLMKTLKIVGRKMQQLLLTTKEQECTQN